VVTAPQHPVLSAICPQLNLLKPPPWTKFLGVPLVVVFVVHMCLMVVVVVSHVTVCLVVVVVSHVTVCLLSNDLLTHWTKLGSLSHSVCPYHTLTEFIIYTVVMVFVRELFHSCPGKVILAQKLPSCYPYCSPTCRSILVTNTLNEWCICWSFTHNKMHGSNCKIADKCWVSWELGLSVLKYNLLLVTVMIGHVLWET
jgi:hypothetical protein